MDLHKKNHIFKKAFFIILIVIAGGIIFYPHHNFQAFLKQADDGRDFYSYKKTFDGGRPYQDYWWLYGPLMPYYYSLSFKLLGVSIQSIFIARNLIILLSGLFFYLSLETLFGFWLAFVATIWFWVFNPNFSFTYNHTGGTFLSIVVVYFLFLFRDKAQKRYILLSLLALSLMSLVKLNMGLAAFECFVICLFLISRQFPKEESIVHRRFFAQTALASMAALIGAYGFFIQGLDQTKIRQCFNYLPADNFTYNSPFLCLKNLCQSHLEHISSSLPNLLFSLLLIFSIVNFVYQYFQKGQNPSAYQRLSSSLLIVVLMIVFMSHEFLFSCFPYRLFWVSPLVIMMNFILIGSSLRSFHKKLQKALLIALLFVALFYFRAQVLTIREFKIPSQYLNFKTAQVYVANTPDWLDTVYATTQYLNTHLSKKETFFAIPYIPLYYFLTEKDSPSWELMFFEHNNISQEQELRIITALEQENVNYVVLSNQITLPESYMGIFGETHCRLLGKYIEEHFKETAVFGNWNDKPGVWQNHGTKILKRIR